MVWSGLVWSGPVWSSPVRFGPGLVWSGLALSGLVRLDLVWLVLVRSGPIWAIEYIQYKMVTFSQENVQSVQIVDVSLVAWTKNPKLWVGWSLMVANDVSIPRECFAKISELLKRNWLRAAHI